MMKQLLPNFSAFAMLCGLLAAAASLTAAQETGSTGRIKITSSVTTTKAAKNVVRRTPPTTTTVRNTGSLVVASESGAKILIRPATAKDFMDEEIISAQQGQVIFDKLAPGTYHVVAEMKGYNDAEADVVIKPNVPTAQTLRLTPEVFDVTIKLNATTGDLKYRLKDSREAQSFVRFANGIAKLNHLRAGVYEIDVKADDAALVVLQDTFDVGEGKVEFSVDLTPRVCYDPFSETWLGLEEWEAPKTWQARRLLTINSSGVALPKATCARNYANFDLTANVRLSNEQGVGFILRARDKQNYYYLQLNGSKAAKPFTMRGFAVVNGVEKPLGNPHLIDVVASSITGKFFTLRIEVRDHQFKVFITDSETAKEEPLGVIIDQSKHYTVGAIGLHNSGTDQAQIESFIVTPVKPAATRAANARD